MLFAMGFNNTILTREMQNRGFERDAVGGFGSEIRDEISKLTKITGNQRKYNLVKPIWILDLINIIPHSSIVTGLE